MVIGRDKTEIRNPKSEPVSKLAAVVRSVVGESGLDLAGRTVFTEAANAPYCMTAAIAAAAGARVLAYARDSRYASARIAARDVRNLANALGCGRRVRMVRERSLARKADIVTNTGLLRPWTARRVRELAPGAVITLMYEAWELREDEIDLDACRGHGVRVIGVNEHDPRFPVFDYVGLLAVRRLLEAGFSLEGLRVGLIGEGPFAGIARKILRSSGARVVSAKNPDAQVLLFADYSCRRAFPFDALDRSLERPTPCLFLTGPRVRPRLSRIRPLGKIPAYQHMIANFSDLGPRPLAELHALSLKAAAEFFSGRKAGLWQRVVP